jgi:hypothetical protein
MTKDQAPMTKQTPNPKPETTNPQSAIRNPKLPTNLYQILIECHAESQQRELFERLRREGLKVRLLVL